MATSIYVFDINDTLIKISNIFNTDVKTLVRLNPCLKNSNGKTYLKPKDAKIVQILDENFFFENQQSYNLLLNNNAFNIQLATVPKDLELNITYNNGTSEIVSLGYDNRFYNTKTKVCQENLSKFNFNNISFSIVDYNYAKTISKMIISYNLVYIIVPVVGNGAISTEDYILSLSDIIGLQCSSIVTNYIAGANDNRLRHTKYNINNLDRYTTDVVSDLVSSNDLTPIDVNSIELDTPELQNIYFSKKVTLADLGITELNRIIQSAIYGVSANTIDRSDFSGELRKSLYKVNTNNSVIGNPFYAKCIVKVGSTTLNMPCYPESVEDGTRANYSTTDLLGRSEPFLIYNNTSGREMSFTFNMHREMTNNEDEIDKIVKVIESGVYPKYGSDIAPQKVEVKIGNQIYISGVMKDEHTSWSGPIDINKDRNGNAYNKYNVVSVTFTVAESTNNPKSAADIVRMGGYREN